MLAKEAGEVWLLQDAVFVDGEKSESLPAPASPEEAIRLW
jgi:hypothetical protein